MRYTEGNSLSSSKYMPYGGTESKKGLSNKSKEAERKYQEEYDRKRSLQPEDLMEDMNEALNVIMNINKEEIGMKELQKHLKGISLLMIGIGVIGHLTLEFF